MGGASTSMNRLSTPTSKPAMTLITTALLAACLSATPSPAKGLNTQGFRLYKAGKYSQALELFEQARLADPAYALAHYNYAATLGVLRKQGKVCEHDAYRSTIVQA